MWTVFWFGFFSTAQNGRYRPFNAANQIVVDPAPNNLARLKQKAQYLRKLKLY